MNVGCQSTELLGGDVVTLLPASAEGTVDVVVTSPPYYGLRDYGVPPMIWPARLPDGTHAPSCDRADHQWGEELSVHRGGPQGSNGELAGRRVNAVHEETKDRPAGAFCARCGAWRGCLGLEPTPGLYVEHLCLALEGVRRVLRPTGTLWLNIGDSYAAGGNGATQWSRMVMGPKTSAARAMPHKFPPPGWKAKDLVGVPWMVAFALREAGWWLRCDVVWNKPRVMPESVRDRPTRAHEYVFLLAKSPRYFYDREMVREDAKPWNRGKCTAPDAARGVVGEAGYAQNRRQYDAVCGANRRSVWTIDTEPFPGAHFAVMPTRLAELCVRAGAPPGACAACGEPLVRDWDARAREVDPPPLRRTCACPEGTDVRRAVVLDPFAGSGTVGVVARREGHSFVGVELKPEYAMMARKRIGNVIPPLFGPTTPSGYADLPADEEEPGLFDELDEAAVEAALSEVPEIPEA